MVYRFVPCMSILLLDAYRLPMVAIPRPTHSNRNHRMGTYRYGVLQDHWSHPIVRCPVLTSDWFRVHQCAVRMLPRACGPVHRSILAMQLERRIADVPLFIPPFYLSKM